MIHYILLFKLLLVQWSITLFHVPNSVFQMFFIVGVYLKGGVVNLKKEIPALSLSPCHFKMLRKDKALDIFDSRKNHKKKDIFERTSSGANKDVTDFLAQDEVVAALSSESSPREDEKSVYQSDHKRGLECLLLTWLLAQLDFIASNADSEVNSLVFSNETVLHFEVKRYKSGTQEKLQASCNGSLENRNKTRDLQVEMFFVLTITDECFHTGKVNAYELTVDERDKRYNNFESVGRLFGKLNFGDPVSFYSLKEKTSIQGLNSNLSSLSWMGTAVSDVINSRYFPQIVLYTSMLWCSDNSFYLKLPHIMSRDHSNFSPDFSDFCAHTCSHTCHVHKI